jgi:hypothetical protein
MSGASVTAVKSFLTLSTDGQRVARIFEETRRRRIGVERLQAGIGS